MKKLVQIASMVSVRTPTTDYTVQGTDVVELARLALALLVDQLGTEGARQVLRNEFALYRRDYFGLGRDDRPPRPEAANPARPSVGVLPIRR
ncbi:hypothetical protein BWR15_06150 [Pseudomonas sp. T]|nr:hypothetical protein BWR15_06150 [Pseudomonas sp. T]